MNQNKNGDNIFYGNRIFFALRGKSKNIQEKTLMALYELGKDGDFSRTGDETVDRALEKFSEVEDVFDIVGDVYDHVEKKIKKTKAKTIKTKVNKNSTKRRRR